MAKNSIDIPLRIQVTSSLRWVRLDQMKVHEQAQRALNQAWADELAKEFNPDLMGFIHVSHRDGWFYIIDGQHRRQAAIQYLGSDQQVQCHVYDNLSTEQEAQLFLELNKTKRQGPMSRYKVALVAGQSDECDVDRIVRALDLRIGSSVELEEIGCISAILSVYKKRGPGPLSAALRIIRDAFGYDGFKREIIEGAAFVVNKHGTALDEQQMVKRLKSANLVELRRQARAMREGSGNALSECVAHKMIEFYNRGREKKLPPWWNFGVAS